MMHTDKLRSLFRVFAVLALLFFGVAAQAQTVLGALGGADSSDTTAIAESIAAAREQGASVIVIDPQGNVIGLGDNSAASNLAAAEETADQQNGTLLMRAQMKGQGYRAELLKKFGELPIAFNEMTFILRATSPSGYISDYVRVLIYTLILFGVGVLFERFVYGPYLAARFVMPMIKEDPVGYADKLPFLAVRFIAGIIGTLIGMGVAYLLGTLIFGGVNDNAIEFTITVIFTAYFLSRAAALLWRMILSPFLSQYRLPGFSDREALVLYRWLWRIAVLEVCIQMFSVWLFELGLNHEVYALFMTGAVLFMALVNVAMILFNRAAINKLLTGGRPASELSLFTRLVAALWAPLCILYLVFAWFRLTGQLLQEETLVLSLLAGAYAVILSSIVVFGVVNYLIERFFRRSAQLRAMREEYEAHVEEEERAEAEAAMMAATGLSLDEADAVMARAEAGDADGDGDEEGGALPMDDDVYVPRSNPIHTYEDLAKRVSGVLAVMVGGFVAVSIWGDPDEIMRRPFVDRAWDVFVILLLGYIAFHAFRIWVDNRIEAEQPDGGAEVELGDEGGAGSASRLGTLLPLFRGFILAVIAVTIVLIVLLELGVNVSPLFAGAGVVGLAIGFGSQALVRDIFSGAFFLLDDAFRKGEYIDIGEVKGTVENISVRSFQLRHHLGALHTIPFGEIRHLTNFSRDWVIMKLPLRVTYDTDVEHVRKLIKKLGISMLDDPEIGDQFIQPLKSQGVIEMQDSAMIIRVKFMTKPGDQWVIRKKVYAEIRELFAREGIKFAHREVTVRLADGQTAENLSEEEKQAVASAALAADDQQQAKAPMDDR